MKPKEEYPLKNTGVTRQVDELGRIVLPIELRRTLNIDTKDGLEIFVDEDKILFRKYERGCVFCSETDGDTVQFHGKRVCIDCTAEMEGLLSQLQAAPTKLD
jgi:AbrB family transcriptional regulator, transcriptional pleiotropic regulator of transition state genes